MTEPGVHCSAHKRRVNGLIHESLSARDVDDPIAFFCECPAENCFETVWLTLGAYESNRLNPRWSAIREEHRERLHRAPRPTAPADPV